MKHILFFFSISLTFMGLAAKNISAPIKSVTVYKQKAKVTRTKTSTIPAGTQEIIISGLSPIVDRNSVQSKILGKVTLLSSSYSINYLEELKDTKIQKVMSDSLKWANNQISILDYKKAVLDGEANLIEQNKQLGGKERGFTVEELTKLSTFYTKRMLAIKSSIFDINQKKSDLAYTKKRIQQWLRSNKIRKSPVGQITLKIEAPATAKVIIECKYLVNNAGWTPSYDIRANNTSEDIQLEYKAQVYQSTGIEWTNIPLTISTGNPNSYSVKPTLNPLFVNFQQNFAYGNTYRKDKAYKKEAPTLRSVELSEAISEDVYEEQSLQVQTNSNTLTVEYEIKNLQTIKSNGNQHLVKLNKMDIPTKFEHHAIPKLSKQVYLQAKLSNWGQYNLEPAQATIFFEGMYIGKTYLNPKATSDTMQISLGVDHNVQVTRTQLKDYKAKKFIGSNRTKTLAYAIEIKNNKTAAINLIIEDQYPISQNSEIEVEVLENGNAKENKRKGLLTWRATIPANSSKKYNFAYSVKYPKNETITNVQ